ncbi:hypothetical protein KZ483_10385 [Paenibacillus sp. sptzw28]|uniref:hypothetical protein n=1 Tax=Paenibacillus sp. sptzw28 TaxID=715179 RepID=UPI001C6DF66D|nr:hypothetical protein [Paenibacillus sp. sptzw28]QYR23282.1 hypothetical protein KZ483_10385 [Paenibacillus sp. sptzw28]
MKIIIIKARMTHTEADGYVGGVEFEAEGHASAYEITLQSKKGKDWSYALLFRDASGKEEDIFAVEQLIEEDDELFDRLVKAAKDALYAN